MVWYTWSWLYCFIRSSYFVMTFTICDRYNKQSLPNQVLKKVVRFWPDLPDRFRRPWARPRWFKLMTLGLAAQDGNHCTAQSCLHTHTIKSHAYTIEHRGGSLTRIWLNCSKSLKLFPLLYILLQWAEQSSGWLSNYKHNMQSIYW